MEEDSRIEFSIGHLQGFKRTTSPLLPTHQDGVHRAEAVFAVVNGREVGFAHHVLVATPRKAVQSYSGFAVLSNCM